MTKLNDLKAKIRELRAKLADSVEILGINKYIELTNQLSDISLDIGFEDIEDIKEDLENFEQQLQQEINSINFNV